MPPRHGKSALCSQYFPPWYIGRHPDHRVMLASYEAGFAASWGRKCKNVLAQSGPEVFRVGLDPKVQASNEWNAVKLPNHRDFHIRSINPGGMSTAGVGGAFSGKGANLLIVDDPIKNSKDAQSEVMREALWDWWGSTAYSRLEPDGVAMVIQTRWHEEDLAGKLIKEMKRGGEHWTVVSFPAIAEEDEDYPEWRWIRKAGEALWPDRYPLSRLVQIRDGGSLSAYWWAALYQQRPQPAGGGLFKRQHLRYFRSDPARDVYTLQTPTGEKLVDRRAVHRFVTVDLAVSEATSADYFALGVWGVTRDNELLLLDVIHDRIAGPDQMDVLRNVKDRWLPGSIEIEATGYQTSLVQQAIRDGLPAVPLPADRDKFTRAQPFAARMQVGAVYFRANLPKLEELENELLLFPNAAHDDLVDMCAYAGLKLIGARVPRVGSIDDDPADDLPEDPDE